jgi:putative spermidine/putrescine transport system permease protein
MAETFSSSAAPMPLRQAVRRAERPARRAAFSLAVPLLLFLAVVFVVPIGMLLSTAVDNPETRSVLPTTLAALQGWNGQGAPDEVAFAALRQDLAVASKDRTAALLGKRLNYDIPGMRSRVMSASRLAIRESAPPFKDAFIAADPVWGETAVWAAIKREGARFTPFYLLSALDLQQGADGSIERVAPDERIFLDILGRTLLIAATVTLLTLILGYPVAYALTLAPPALAALMMLCILLPLWTSLLVRTTAWVVLLQSNGVINDLLLTLGLTSHRVQLIFTRFGTITAMTHIQLPFTILPIASVMRTIPLAHMRAARSLGAPPAAAFWRVYIPQTNPGARLLHYAGAGGRPERPDGLKPHLDLHQQRAELGARQRARRGAPGSDAHHLRRFLARSRRRQTAIGVTTWRRWVCLSTRAPASEPRALP